MGSLAERVPANGGALAKRRVSKQQSRVTNGTALFPATIRDGRTGWSRRFKDLIAYYVAHLGGEDIVTLPQRSTIRRIAAMEVECEWKEQGWARSVNGPSNEDLDCYARLSNSLDRKLAAIGMERRSRDVSPTLSDYLQQVDNDEAAEP